MHASHVFSQEHPEIFNNWYKNSNYLAFLSVKNENDLIKILEKSIRLNIKCSYFREPDIDNQITAIVLEPSYISKKLCSNFPLALK